MQRYGKVDSPSRSAELRSRWLDCSEARTTFACPLRWNRQGVFPAAVGLFALSLAMPEDGTTDLRKQDTFLLAPGAYSCNGTPHELQRTAKHDEPPQGSLV